MVGNMSDGNMSEAVVVVYALLDGGLLGGACVLLCGKGVPKFYSPCCCIGLQGRCFTPLPGRNCLCESRERFVFLGVRVVGDKHAPVAPLPESATWQWRAVR